jgi:uncharacterized tellurite resistance protein B-like protein
MLMEMSELTAEEEIALIGLLKAVIQVDKKLSAEESKELNRVAKLMGAERFHERVEEAKKLFHTLSDIKKHAQKIERQPARQLIFNLLFEMAKRDEVIPEEEDLLAWLAEIWGVEFFRK